MKKIVLAFAICLIGSFSLHAQTITPEEAAKHIGDSVTVCGKIFGGRYFEGSITLLNMGAAYPKSPLTIVVAKENRSNFTTPPEELYNEKEVCIKGVVKEFKGKPQIFIAKESDVQIK